MAEKYLTHDPARSLDEAVESLHPDKVLVVTDRNVNDKVLPLLMNSKVAVSSKRFIMNPGEEHKTLQTVEQIWNALEENGATRNSVVMNIGGGVVTDIGGFAAATFKRGIRTINLPTTLLGAVDAASGGKTGINFHNLKNEIGAFHKPEKVIVATKPFVTLPLYEVMSGYAEMVKTAIISDKKFYTSLYDFQSVYSDPDKLGEAVEKCLNIKDEIVSLDPKDKGLRKVLNFGHTAGHAFESLNLERGNRVSHGHCVAHGMLTAMILSNIVLSFSSTEINFFANFLKEYYPGSFIGCKDIEAIMQLMGRDKKNSSVGIPRFVLLEDIGVPKTDCSPSSEEIREALEIYRDFTA